MASRDDLYLVVKLCHSVNYLWSTGWLTFRPLATRQRDFSCNFYTI